ncbi:MAG: rhodanese-like domain-containing protein [Actinobacteria bacterium]|nr:rhodanese-like domain-containing protein [Actinomycetota bacterium]
MKRVHRFRHAILILACLLIALGVTGCSQEPSTKSSSGGEKVKTDGKTAAKEFDISVYKNNEFLITPQQLKKLLGSEDLVLLDADKPDIYAKEHIPGAIGIGIQAFSNKIGKPGDPGWGTILKKDELKQKLESLGVDNKKTVVLYSDVFRGPGADGRAVWQLKVAGLDNVKLLAGGLSYWKELGYEVTSEPAQPKPKTGVELKDYDESYIATKEYVFGNLDKQVLVDVRTEVEYKGSQNAGEPRGGHIKGAKSMLWQNLLNKNGTPKSPDEIKKIMASYGVKPDDNFTVY